MTTPAATSSPTRARAWTPDVGHLLRSVKRLHGLRKDTPVPGAFTAPQFVVLLAVSRVPGVDQRTAGELASLDQATVSGVVSRLAARGRLEERPDPDDGRRKRLHVTPETLELVRADSAKLRRADAEVLAALTAEERETVIDELSRIAYSRTIDPTSRTVSEVAEADVFSVAETSRAFGRVTRICNQLHAAIWREQAGSFVTPVQHSTLTAIAATPAVGQNTLAGTLSLTKATVADIVGRLRRNGLVEVDGHPTDRRQQIVAATPAGRDALKLTTRAEHVVREMLLEPVTRVAPSRLEELLTRILDAEPA